MKPVVNVFNVGRVSASVTRHRRRQGSRRITGPRSKETSCACRFGGLRAAALTHPTLTHADPPGLEWEIRCDGQPRDPYLTFDRIINPWGLSGFPIYLRLELGSLVQLVAGTVGVGGGPSIPVLFRSDPSVVNRVGGRLLGRYWYNPMYGGEPGEALHRR